MKNYVLLNYDYIFNDHMAKCSNQAKLYYIKLMFFANNGFVANPMEVLDSFGFDKGVFQELVNNDELLTLPGRDEVFITAYFIHTCFNPASWLKTPYAIYWRGHLTTKKNGVATFKGAEDDDPPTEPETKKEKLGKSNSGDVKPVKKSKWDSLLDDLETP